MFISKYNKIVLENIKYRLKLFLRNEIFKQGFYYIHILQTIRKPKANIQMPIDAACVALLHRSLLQKHVSISPVEVQPSVIDTTEQKRTVSENKVIN